MRECLPVLRWVPLFQGLPDGELLEALDCLGATERRVPRGAAVLRAGEEARGLGCVLSGGVQVLREGADGSRMVLAALEPGELFGESYACARAATLAVSVCATQDSRVLLLEAGRIQAPCQRACAFHTALIRNLVGVLAEKNLLLSEKLRHLSGRTIRERLLSYLEEQAVLAGRDSFTIPFDRQALADYLCTDRSALSRELGRLRVEGVLDTRRSRFTLHREGGAG